MEKISSQLRDQISAAGSDSNRRLDLIITLNRSSDWLEGVREIQEAGFEVTSHEEAIRVLFGNAAVKAIAQIAAVPVVELIELEQRATIMR